MAELISRYLIRNNHDVKIVNNLEQLNYEIIHSDLDPNVMCHVAISPPHLAFTSILCRNINVTAWEFPDIPMNPRNSLYSDWRKFLNDFDVVFALNQESKKAFQSAGIKDVRILDWDIYSDILQTMTGTLESPKVNVQVIRPRPRVQATLISESSATKFKRIYQKRLKKFIHPKIHSKLVKIYHPISRRYKLDRIEVPTVETINHTLSLQEFKRERILIGTWLNPEDSRKNLKLILDVILFQMRTNNNLRGIIKIHGPEYVTANVFGLIRQHADFFGVEIDRIGIVNTYLSDAEMERLRFSTDVYINLSKGEGLCLPAMEHLLMGVPLVVPKNTAFLDYPVVDTIYFVQCSPEPASFPGSYPEKFETFIERPLFFDAITQLGKAVSDVSQNRDLRIDSAKKVASFLKSSQTDFLDIFSKS